jgi:hypothetical protein
MVDFVHMPPFPARFAAPLRDALSGARAAWPETVTREEQDVIEAHGMLPMLYHYSRLPELRDAALNAAAIESLRLTDLREVLAALASHGVVPLIVKGTALAYSIYDAPELRPRGDTDLLIGANELDRVRAALAPLRFSEKLTSGDELGVRQKTFERVDRFGLAHGYDVHLDIANPATVARALTYEDMRSRALDLPRIAAGALAPSLVDSLLYACIHRVVHHHSSDRLMWLYDVHLLANRLSSNEWSELWSRALERRVVTICKVTLDDARHWFGGDDFGKDAPAVGEEPSAAFLIRDRTRGAVLATELKALTWGERFKRMRQLAFPPADFVMQSFGVRNRAALPALYAWRALRGLGRLFRRV